VEQDRARITDVGPRDGLQNEPGVIAAADKAELVQRLSDTGVDEVEVTSFVSPKWVPQLGDAEEVFELLAAQKPSFVTFSALVPNEKGMDKALAVNERVRSEYGVERLIDKVSVFTAASETFAKNNVNASISESIERFKPVVSAAHEHGLRVRGYVSCVVECPYEGRIDESMVGQVVQLLLDLGIEEIDLGDTLGVAEPADVNRVLNAVLNRVGETRLENLTLHLHDTFGRASECVGEAVRLGVRSFDGSVAGLGGCPFASTPERAAPGNIATETLIGATRAAGLEDGVDLERLGNVAAFARRIAGTAREEAGDRAGENTAGGGAI